MKKVVLSLAIVAAMFVSCKEAATETPAADSTAVVVEETVEVVEPVADSTAVVADSTAAPAATEAPAAK